MPCDHDMNDTPLVKENNSSSSSLLSERRTYVHGIQA